MFQIKLHGERITGEVIDGLLVLQLPALQLDPVNQDIRTTEAPLTIVNGRIRGWAQGSFFQFEYGGPVMRGKPKTEIDDLCVDAELYRKASRWLKRTLQR